MRNTRRTQPYRAKTGRAPGPALTAMLRGRTAYGQNPQDAKRKLQKRARHRRGLAGAWSRRGR